MKNKIKPLTKKQRKEFIRLWIGSNLFHLDFGLDDVDISDDDIPILYKEKIRLSDKYLKEDNAFATTPEIYEFVLKNY